MKINSKYLSIAIYALAVIVAGSLLVMLMFAAGDFIAQKKYMTFVYVLQPFIYGFIIAYMLNPLMVFIEVKIFSRIIKNTRDVRANARLRRMLSVFFTLVTTVVVVTLLSVTVSPQVADSINQLTEHVSELFSPINEDAGVGDITASDPEAIYNELMNRRIGLYVYDTAASIQNYASRFGVQVDIERSARELFLSAVAGATVFFNDYFQEIFNATANFIVATARQVFNLLLAIVAAFYMLAGKERHIYQVKRLLYAFFPLFAANKLLDVTRKTHIIFGGFFRGKILESLIVGVICFICMTLFGIEYPLLISLIVGITNIIPFFGPFIGAIPSIFFLLLYDPSQALWFAVFILILQQIDGNFIGPKIIGDTMGLSPFWIIFAVMVMTGLMGPVGMFIGVPVFGVIYTLLKDFSAWRLARKGVLPSVIAPAADIPESIPPEESVSVAKISSLVDGLAKNIQKYIQSNKR
jgi:predicted PurR-regulated permease PerM